MNKKERILLFIPMYNCEKQIPRVLRQLRPRICSYLSEVIIVNNRSTDDGEAVVSAFLKELSLPVRVKLLRNDENYGLGGSHKVAFRYALENGIVDFGNEPSFHIPWLFAYVGRGDLVEKWAGEVAKLFGEELPGDNDSGAMSSLYVFLKLGFFPIAGQDVYIMHGSAYPEIRIALGGGKAFAIRSVGCGNVKSVTLNGVPHDPLFLRHGEIMSGGELVFVRK